MVKTVPLRLVASYSLTPHLLDSLTLDSSTSSIPAVAVFARVPIAGHAKTRLIPLLGAQAAAGLQAALISDTLRKVARLKGCVQPYLFLAGNSITFHGSALRASRPLLCMSTDRRKSRGPQNRGSALPDAAGARRSLDAGRGARATFSWAPPCIGEFRIIRQQGEDLGERLENAFRTLLRLHPSCVVIGADSPLLPARILRQALRELHALESVLGPCPDGGYYLIALRRPLGPGMLQGIFRRVRWSTALAFRDTLRNLLRLGLSCSVLEECADVDLPRDLQRLKKNLSRNRAARRQAPATSRFLKGVHAKAQSTQGPQRSENDFPLCAPLRFSGFA
jgi:hypothetical protein